MSDFQIKQICCGYNNHPVITDFSGGFKGHCITGILGPNGSGKTTLLKVLLKLLPLQAGSIELDGRNIQTIPIREYAQRVAYVAQQVGDIFDFSVEDVLLMGRYPHQDRGNNERDTDVLMHVLSDLDCEALRYRQCHEISGGELQRVMIGRALMQQPDFLLLDEPTSNLDITGINRLAVLLKSLSVRSGLGCILVSHELNFLQAVCDEILLFSQGKLIQVGTPEAVLVKPWLQQVFGEMVM